VDRMCCARGGEELILGFFGSNRGSNAVRLALPTGVAAVEVADCTRRPRDALRVCGELTVYQLIPGVTSAATGSTCTALTRPA
jgi:hypothetical protein